MKAWKKQLTRMLAAGLFVMSFSGIAWASTTKTSITKVDLTIDSGIEVGDDTGDVTVTVTDSDSA
ncbi:MAG: hypothetical protein LUE86_12240, partial [Clostridiales bacterium]|nr:hypothetical protein [Clostridiales bacterium]